MQNQADGGSPSSPTHAYDGAQGRRGAIGGTDIYDTDDQPHLDTSAEWQDDRANQSFDIHHDRISPVETSVTETDDRGGGSEGPIETILRQALPLVCAQCGTRTRDLFSKTIQIYAGNPTERTYRTILCRDCRKDEVDDRERAQQASADRLQDKCKECGEVFRLAEIGRSQRSKAVGNRRCSGCAAKRNTRWQTKERAPGSSITNPPPSAAPALDQAAPRASAPNAQAWPSTPLAC